MWPFDWIKEANRKIAASGLPGAKIVSKIPAYLAINTAAAGLLVGGAALAGGATAAGTAAKVVSNTRTTKPLVVTEEQNLIVPAPNEFSNSLNTNNMLTTIWTWIKGNMLLSAGIAIVAILIFKPNLLRGLTGRTRRVRHRRNVRRAITGTTRRRRRSSYTRRNKKPWQIKGSLAARRRMAQIRRKGRLRRAA